MKKCLVLALLQCLLVTGSYGSVGEFDYRAGLELSSLDTAIPAPSATPVRGLSEAQLRAVIGTNHNGFISPAKVAELRQASGWSTEELMLGLLSIARDVARPQVSGFHVGAIGLGQSGALYLGGNLEFIGLPVGQFVHAEQAVVANAKIHKEKRLLILAVSANPCGHCRQFLVDLGFREQLTVLTPTEPPITLDQLLPRAFVLPKPRNVLDLYDNKLAAPPGIPLDDLLAAALQAANEAYSTYSPSGVALKTRDGRVFPGFYIEVTGANPSLPPLQTALIALTLSGRSYADIVEAALVELDGTRISQEAVTREILARVAPGAALAAAKVSRQP